MGPYSGEGRHQNGAKENNYGHGRGCDCGENSRRRYMPDELTIEILSYLPSKSLMRFKSVSNYWFSVIESPSFVSKHYNRPSNARRILVHQFQEHPALASSIDTIISCRNCISSFSPNNVSQVYSHHFDPGTDFASNGTKLFGPVDGIFCIYNTDCQKVALWNPATNELKHLPQNHHLFRVDNESPEIESDFVFGLNPVTNCYKVVWVMYHCDIWIYDLGTAQDVDSCWRSVISSFDKLDNYRDLGIDSDSGKYVKGVCYWIAEEGWSGNQYTMLAFDMATEVFRKVSIPLYRDYNYFYYRLEYLVPYESMALIISYDRDGKDHFCHFDTWAMEEDGNFVKRCTSSSFDIRQTSGDKNPDFVIWLWEEDEVLMKRTDEACSDRVLVLYKLHADYKEEMKTLPPVPLDSDIFIYKESMTTIRTASSSSSIPLHVL